MADVLFNITCTTCEARLNVRDKSAIGAIVNCPKCGGMVQIVPPADWQEPAEQTAEREKPESPVRGLDSGKKRPVAAKKPPAERSSVKSPRQQRPASSAGEGQARSPDGARKVAGPSPTAPAAPREKPKKSPAKKVAGAAAASVAGVPEAVPGAETSAPTPGPAETALPVELPAVDAPPVQAVAEMAPVESMPVTQMARMVNPAELAMRRWLLWGAVPVAGVVILIGALSLFSGGESAPDADGNEQIPVGSVSEDNSSQVPVSQIAEFDDRWVPDAPQLVLSLDVAGSHAAGQLESLLEAVPALNRAIVSELFQGFGLRPEAVERLQWSSTDLTDWSRAAVVVIELVEGQSTASLRTAGTGAEWQFAGIEVRRLNRSAWSRAFAVLGDKTIVTGEEGVLRQVAERGERAADLGTLEPLLTAAPADADFSFALDLRAATKAGWPLPTEWLDVWPQGRDSWHVIWRLPSALFLSFDREDLALAELGLLCDGETTAEKVRAALEQWIPQAKSVLKNRIASLPASVESDEIPAGAVRAYQQALRGASDALASSHSDVSGRCVWLRVDCGSNSSAWTAAAAGSQPVIRADWYRAAGTVDRARQERLHGAVTGYTKAEEKGPPGAINSGALPPENVLSWMTAMLPYLGHEAWAEDINPSYSWDSRKNRPVTSRALEAVLNPAVPARETSSGYPVTHYVGMAGIGPDAASLPRDDPRAGIFGYRETRRLTDVPDGASNTIATIGVSGSLGSWAAGGAATVRGFTEKPYVNGPDGFGSGVPGGMYVGMADGSSRFLSADTDPTVLEQLATAAGGDVAPVQQPSPEQVVRVEPREPAPEETPVPRPVEEPPTQVPAEEVIDVAERLRVGLPGISATNTPLCQVVRALEDYGSLVVTYDLDTMSAMNLPLDQSVSEQEIDITVGEALDVVLSSCGLKAVVRDNQLWATGAGQASETPRTVRYTIADLTSTGDSSAEEIASWIPRLIAPQTWQVNGGPGTIEAKNGALEITQVGTVQLEVLVFCERLRVARGLSPRSGRPARQFPLATRRTRATSRLQQPVTVNFFRPTGLRRVVQELDTRCDALIAVNWLALAAEGKFPSLPTQLSVSQVPLGEAFDEMLGPQGLDYRAIDERTIEVTTRAAADAHYEREFYPVRDLLNTGKSLPVLIEQVRAQVDGGTWQSKGGRGAMQFDEPSQCLIILQTQRGHVAIERYLKGLRAKTAGK